MSNIPKLYITGWRHVALDDFNSPTMAPKSPPTLEAYLEITGTSLHTEPFPNLTNFITIKAEADCAIAFGGASDDEPPVAHPEFNFIEAGERLMYGVEPGGSIAVIEVL